MLQPKWVEVRLDERGAQVVQLDPTQAAALVLQVAGEVIGFLDGETRPFVSYAIKGRQALQGGAVARCTGKLASPRVPRSMELRAGWPAGRGEAPLRRLVEWEEQLQLQ